MDYSELDEQELNNRKEQMVQWRTKKKNSTLFMIFASIFEIIVSLLIIIALFCISALIVFRLFHADGKVGQIVFEVLTISSFIGGMILGFFIYKIAARWVIQKFDLESKMLEEVMIHYRKLSKEEKKAMKESKMKR